MNSIEILMDEYGILTDWKNSRPYFSGVWKWQAEAVKGNREPYEKISALMKDIEQNGRKYETKDERIIIESTKEILVFYPGEIRKLALNDEELYIKALKRGKSELRYRTNERRLLNGRK